MRLSKLSFEEHKLIGYALKLISNKLHIQDYYFKNKKEMISSPVNKAKKLNMNLKSVMEEIMFKDYPQDSTLDIYYGKIEDNSPTITQDTNKLIEGDKT
jgi:hypothetical protein